MSKAFDSINHGILLNKLQDIGASISALQWFNSYLPNRTQTVRIHSALSDPLPMVNGVPQGSILGPILFSIYINDLPKIPRSCSTDCYVDDTKLICVFLCRTIKVQSPKSIMILSRYGIGAVITCSC